MPSNEPRAVHRRPIPAEHTEPPGPTASDRSPSREHPAQHPAERPRSERSTSREGPSTSTRDAFFDNAKYLSIALVALGHAWEPLYSTSRTAAALYLFVYAFHMPAFVVISGYFSRTFDTAPHRLSRLVTGVAVPYVVFQTAYILFRRTAGQDPHAPLDLLNPWFLTWFLMALFVWRLTAPLWRNLRGPVPVALIIAAAACATPSIGQELDLQRILQFLPFFVLGLTLKARHFAYLHRLPVRLAALPVLAAALAFAYWAVPRMNDAWLYHTDSAQALGAPWWAGVVMQLALFGSSSLLTACFLAWVPTRRVWFTTLGAGTLYGYLLHGFLAKGSRFWHWYNPAWVHTPGGALCVSVVAVTVVTALCTTPVRRVFRFAVEPRMRWAFRRA
ncbi:acyltransferase family protein [Streptomyces sp. NPDC059740]|uniref:acyltransferase family protein n=1 Tax=Streptomyces sp. NPDC059740 TaxID=3346926 RepID=UPI00365DCA9D